MYKILNPHPVLKAKYRKEGVLRFLFEKNYSAIMSELQFFTQCANPIYDSNRDTNDPKLVGQFMTGVEEDPTRPIERKITNVYRVRTPNGQEFIYYHESLKGRNFLKNKMTHSRAVGKFHDVEFNHSIDRNGKVQFQAHDIDRNQEPTYEMPFKDGITDPSTSEKINLKDLARFMTQNTNFYVFDGFRKYGLSGTSAVTFDEFLARPFTDLVHLGWKGAWPIEEAKVKAK